MSSGLKADVKSLRTWFDPSNRYIDLAFVLQVKETGEFSRVFGGCYDRWSRRYAGAADDIWILQVSAEQFKAIMSSAKLWLGFGGRGSGKSHFLARWALTRIIDNCGWQLQITSPTYKKTKILHSTLLAVAAVVVARPPNPHWQPRLTEWPI